MFPSVLRQPICGRPAVAASPVAFPGPAIARLVAADEDTVRDVICLFNEKGLAALDPQQAGGRPRLISDEVRAGI
jgi:Winged helix-turn helix